LLVSSTAKLTSLWDNFAAGLSPDPVIRALYVRDLLIIAMVMEQAVAVLLVYSPSILLKATALIGLTSVFVAYRTGRLLYKVYEPCNCMGMVVKYFPLLERFESALIWAILLFLMVGSYLAMLSNPGVFSSIKRYAPNNQV
jgi:hypothetical protein